MNTIRKVDVFLKCDQNGLKMSNVLHVRTSSREMRNLDKIRMYLLFFENQNFNKAIYFCF